MTHHDHHDPNDPHAGEDRVHVHIGSVKMYLGIFFALIFFTLLTIGVASIHLGPLNLAVAIVIATIKAGLVVTFFMHLKDDKRLNAIIFIGSLGFVGVFLTYKMNDTERRREVDPTMHAYIEPATGESAPGGIDRVKLKAELQEIRDTEYSGHPAAAEAEEHEEHAEPAEPAAH